MSRSALLVGSTGLVGRELALAIAKSDAYGQLHLLVRRPDAALASQPKVTLHVVDFDALPALPRVDDVYIALGTTIKQAGSQEAFRRVDHDYVMNAASAALAAGAQRLGIVSAVGADAGSRVFYNRVKGEMERAVRELGYASVVIARPSLLLGDRRALGQPARKGEVWAERLLEPISPLIPASYRPVRARDVAAALLRALLSAAPGVRLLAASELHDASR